LWSLMGRPQNPGRTVHFSDAPANRAADKPTDRTTRTAHRVACGIARPELALIGLARLAWVTPSPSLPNARAAICRWPFKSLFLLIPEAAVALSRFGLHTGVAPTQGTCDNSSPLHPTGAAHTSIVPCCSRPPRLVGRWLGSCRSKQWPTRASLGHGAQGPYR
jgi:hypothetical protein